MPGERGKQSEYRRQPLNERCIVFESLWGRKYSCNPAALYEYIDKYHPEYECVWFLNDTDTPIKGRAKKVKRGTDEHKYYLATAKYFVFNNNMPRSFKKRAGQVIVHTMHGTPFKSFGLDVKEETDTEEKRIRIVERSDQWDYLVAQGRFTKDMAWQWFRYNKTVLETGYPRTDALYRNNEEEASALRRRLGLPEGKRVILYAPTWREEDRFDMMLNIEEMRSALSDEYVLLIRLHHFVADYYKVPEDGSFVFDAAVVDDIEDLFMITDVMITDYSSVMFDFALTEKPLVFYTYDLKDYTEKDRGSYFDIRKEAPGVIALTTADVIDAVLNGGGQAEEDAERVRRFCEKYLTYENPSSTEAVFDAVFVKDMRDKRDVAKEKAVSVASAVIPGRLIKKARRASVKRRLSKENV